MMSNTTPSLGVRFDVNRLNTGSYGIACWEIFWSALDPARLAGASLFEGDTSASLNGHENVFCIAIQSADAGVLGLVKAALSNHAPFNDVCAPPRFVEGDRCTREPLVEAGAVNSNGEILGDAWNSRPGLEAARSKQAPSRSVSGRVEKLFVQWDHGAVQELERMCNSLPTLPRSQADRFFAAVEGSAAKPVERQSGRVFASLMGVVSASDRKDFLVSYDLTPARLGTGVMVLETYDETIGVIFCVARVSETQFMTNTFMKSRRTSDALLSALNLVY